MATVQFLPEMYPQLLLPVDQHLQQIRFQAIVALSRQPVAQPSGKVHTEQRVLVYVQVMGWRLGHADGICQFRLDVGEQPQVCQIGQRAARLRQREHLPQFVPDPFAADILDRGRPLPDLRP